MTDADDDATWVDIDPDEVEPFAPEAPARFPVDLAHRRSWIDRILGRHATDSLAGGVGGFLVVMLMTLGVAVLMFAVKTVAGEVVIVEIALVLVMLLVFVGYTLEYSLSSQGAVVFAVLWNGLGFLVGEANALTLLGGGLLVVGGFAADRLRVIRLGQDTETGGNILSARRPLHEADAPLELTETPEDDD